MYFFGTTDKVASISEKTEKKIIIPKKEVEEKIVIKQEEPKKIAPIVQKKESKTDSDNNNSMKSTITFNLVSKDKVTEEMIADLDKDIFIRGDLIKGYIDSGF